MRKTWIWASALGLLTLVGGAALAAKPLARQVIEKKAAGRGLVVAVDKLSLGWFRAELRGVHLQLEGVPGVKVRLDQVEAKMGPSLALERVVVHGGQASLVGTVDALRESVAAWKSRRPALPASSNGGGSSRVEIARDLELTWSSAFGGKNVQTVKGLQLERTPQGLRVGADLVALNSGSMVTQIAGASLETSREALVRGHIQKLGAAEMRIDWKAGRPSDGDFPAPEPRPKGDEENRRPAGGRNKKKPPPLARMLKPHPERTTQLRAALLVLREKILPRLPDEAQIDRLWLSATKEGERLEIGPNRLSAKSKQHAFEVELTPREQTKGTPLAVKLSVPKAAPSEDEAAVSLALQGGPVSLSALGLKDGPFGLRGTERTFAEGQVEARLSADAKRITASGNAALDGLSIDSRALSDSVVVFPRMQVKGNGLVATDGTQVSADEIEVALGEARFEGNLHLQRQGEAVLLKARAVAPLVSCQALLDSAPRGLLGPVEGMKFRGTFSLKSGVNLNTSELSKMRVQWNFENGCKATSVPRVLDPKQFRELFFREVSGAGAIPMRVEFGPHSSNWSHYENVSPHMESALLVTEDGRFFRHDGFDDRAIESAIFDNAMAGNFVRGASTISMQLAKNLYLSRDKTLSRKFQEAALTSLLEQSFEKKELLELYVNVVEFGPGIYGIRQASEYYFNSLPSELSAAQSFFLASVLPNPNREFFNQDGSMKDGTARHVRHLLKISHKRGRLNDQELEAALAEELRFGQAASEAAPTLGDHEGEPNLDLKDAPRDPSEATTSRDERERTLDAPRPRRGIEL